VFVAGVIGTVLSIPLPVVITVELVFVLHNFNDYKYKIWEKHKHDLIPEYEADGKTYRTWTAWQCRLCGACYNPNIYFINNILKDSFRVT
jgi:hypothetical protein